MLDRHQGVDLGRREHQVIWLRVAFQGVTMRLGQHRLRQP